MSNQSYLLFFFFFIPLHAMDVDPHPACKPSTSITCSGNSIPLEELNLTELTTLKMVLEKSPKKNALKIKRALDKTTKLILMGELIERINKEHDPDKKSYLRARLRTKQLNLAHIYPEYKANELPVASKVQRQRSKSSGTTKPTNKGLTKAKSERSLKCKSPRKFFGLRKKQNNS